MGKKSQHQHDDASSALKRSENKFRAFAKIWNDARLYPAKYDLERHFNQKMPKILAQVRRYVAFRTEHPEFGMPELIWRKAVTGGMIIVPETVIKQLDEFRIDPSLLASRRGFVVTGAQFGGTLNSWFWASLKRYAEHRHLPLIVMPIKYGSVKTVYQKETGGRRLTSTFPDELKGHLIFENVRFFGDELELNVMRMRPTLDTFLTPKVCERGGLRSQIFAAPKLELKHQMRIGRNHAKALMTTGAVTHPNYAVDNLGQQDRVGEIAAEEHQFAAIVVEFGKKGFHFRQLLANKRGEFYDINVTKGGADFFTQSGVEHRPDDVDTLYAGDLHIGITDPFVEKARFGKGGIAETLRPKNWVWGDDIDGWSINHYDEERQGARRAWKSEIGFNSLELEMRHAVAKHEWMRDQIIKHVPDVKMHRIASNHPEFVTDYIEQKKWALPGNDRNAEIGAEMFLAMKRSIPKPRVQMKPSGALVLPSLTPKELDVRPIDPVVWYFAKECPWLISHERTDKLLLPAGHKHAILCSLHGDKSSRGKQTRSTKEFRKVGIRTLLGHNHSAEIDGIAWRVGTSTMRTQHYVAFPDTAWTQTDGIIFKNAQRQLINYINGEWHGIA